jgi:hypothetical protein
LERGLCRVLTNLTNLTSSEKEKIMNPELKSDEKATFNITLSDRARKFLVVESIRRGDLSTVATAKRILSDIPDDFKSEQPQEGPIMAFRKNMDKSLISRLPRLSGWLEQMADTIDRTPTKGQ